MDMVLKIMKLSKKTIISCKKYTNLLKLNAGRKQIEFY
ncbi:hypothetical protein CBC_A1230 [Clostridium botulinum C str. Eklund]|nr:hypothetical protein CBC_A1230 [Clostridium botulinum C str. Eklund]